MKNSKNQLHYYLVSGTVVIENGDTIQAIPQMAIVTSDHTNITKYHLGKCQQGLQLNLFQKMGNNVPVIVDVLINNIVRLGLMTEEQFHKTPEGIIKAPVEQSSAEIIPFDGTKEDG